MAAVERDEQDMLQYGGGRSLLGTNLKVFVLFPNAAVTIVQNGGVDDNLEASTIAENGGENTDLQAEGTINEGGSDTI